jgi:hypothetical protein
MSHPHMPRHSPKANIALLVIVWGACRTWEIDQTG